MINHPLDSFAWQRKIARAELPLTTKSVAMFLAYFADPDGSRVRPGERLLAAITGLTERAVRRHLATLRDLGLIERVEHGKAPGRADVYQLTVPNGPVDTVPARLDDRWRHLQPAAPPVAETDDSPATGSQDPVDNAHDEAVENLDNRTRGSRSGAGLKCAYRNLVTPLPEPGRRSTGTPVPPTNQTIHHQPTTGSSQVTDSLAAPRTTDDDRATRIAQPFAPEPRGCRRCENTDRASSPASASAL